MVKLLKIQWLITVSGKILRYGSLLYFFDIIIIIIIVASLIQISDDEDDTHPNIDTASLFRWRHQARLEREEQRAKEIQQIEAQKLAAKQKIEELKKKEKVVNNEELEKEFKHLELEQRKYEEKERELIKAERMAPWNVDTISKESWSKTIFNKPAKREDTSNLTNEELELRYKEFVEKHEAKVKEYGMLSKFDDSKQFLMQNQDLGNLLVDWLILYSIFNIFFFL